MKSATLIHGYGFTKLEKNWSKTNTLDIPGGPICTLESNEHYKILVVTNTYAMLGFNSVTELVKRLGIGWRRRGDIQYIGLSKA